MFPPQRKDTRGACSIDGCNGCADGFGAGEKVMKNHKSLAQSLAKPIRVRGVKTDRHGGHLYQLITP